MMTDRELLQAWQGGDTGAADELIGRHRSSLRRFFRNKIDRDVDALIQDTLTTCVERCNRWTESWTFRAFLLTVARDRLVTWYRRQLRRSDLDPNAASVIELGASPGTDAAQGAEQRLVLEGLQRLPLEQQITLELSYWEQMSGAEIAQVLGVPEGTVRSRLDRGRDRLCEEIEARAESREELGRTLGELDRWVSELRETM
ncbi:MAG: sigma-70 family RNA polymerase sigma factor [Myxococcales bacterium]|nr:sigma-70 family RNA polymerase sigma factor [Myxococcales bacterium]